MLNSGLDVAQFGIKFARRNINNLGYADDTTLMALAPIWASLVTQLVKNLPAMQETLVQFESRRSLGDGIGYAHQYSWASLMAQMVKNPLAMRET